MLGNRFAKVGAAMLVAAIAITGCASAAAKTSAPRSSGAGRQVRIMVYSINSDGPDFRAVLAGAIGDYGPAVTVYPDGKVDPEHTSELELNLTRGSFRLNIAELDQRFTAVTSHEPIYPRTCSDYVSVTVPVPVVAGSGTGSYQKISGSFTVTATLNEDETPPCQEATTFLWQVITMSGSGTLTP
jgi:hypothetical protein